MEGKQLKIYFAGSIRGGRAYEKLYKSIIKLLQNYGSVLTEHIGSDLVNDLEMNKTDKDIYEADVTWLKSADLIVADVSLPSLGVGYELGMASALNKKVLCLYHTESESKLSAMITGEPFFNIFNYANENEVLSILRTYFNENY